MSIDRARAGDFFGVGVGLAVGEGAHGTTRWRVQRWDAEQTQWVVRRSGLVEPQGHHFAALGVRPYAVSEVVGNLITTAGWTRLMQLLTGQGSSPQVLDGTHVRIGVGDSSTAEAYTDTDLKATTNRYFQPVTADATLGTRQLSFSATFDGTNGNFAWNEFGLDVTSSTATGGTTVGALLFNRKAGIAQGTKASGQTWTATATVSFS